ncbi:MAG TPA: sigma 54-interacting transcriptional regulator [Myxococcota bacterium]|nr:sigma 54-interacting transcriptional regulator [Myxococcota bacterium]HRY96659.1 sigma 54-interacting transcriptional regulator [Myxococcota bacterium]
MNGDAASRPAIRISRGSDTIMVLPFLEAEVVKIGRGRDCDLQIPDLVVAPHQCDLALTKDGVHLRDQSGAGTVVDGKAVQEATLAPGAVVVLGAIRLELSRNEACGGSLASQLGSCGTEDIPRSGPLVSCPFVLAGVLPSGKKIRVHLGSNLNIGRHGGNDLVINAPDISAFHSLISRRTDGWYVTDQGSRNGTFLNGVRVREAKLELGQTLRIGSLDFTIEPAELVQLPGKVLTWNPGMLEVLEAVSKAARTSWPVLITGERGTGKELIARALHDQSGRPRLVTLNCSAVPSELIESELFGHEKGTFTGATKDRPGKFEQADGGTLFLDEVGDMPPGMQAKLLRALQEGEVARLGSDEILKVDVRVVAATNKPLMEMIKDGRFRADLYDRLNVVRIDIPPLRARPEDLRFLAEHFLGQHLGELKRSLRFSEAALARVQSYPWPGNVRELKSAVMRSILAAKGAEIQPGDLDLRAGPESEPGAAGSFQDQVDAKEKELIEREIALRGSLRAASQSLGIAYSTLKYRAKKLGIRSKSR